MGHSSRPRTPRSGAVRVSRLIRGQGVACLTGTPHSGLIANWFCRLLHQMVPLGGSDLFFR